MNADSMTRTLYPSSLRLLLGALTVAGLAACTQAPETTADSFHAPMQDYLAKRGDLCLAKTAWPIDVTQHEIDVGARNARQMPVLERLGLASSSVADIDVDDEGTPHHLKVRRFELTEAGRKYYIAHDGAGGARQDFCAARLSLDRVVGFDLRSTANGRQQAVVSYTYRVDPAPWTEDAEIRKVFPMVATVVQGAGSAQLQETFAQTDKGWVAVDLLGS